MLFKDPTADHPYRLAPILTLAPLQHRYIKPLRLISAFLHYKRRTIHVLPRADAVPSQLVRPRGFEAFSRLYYVSEGVYKLVHAMIVRYDQNLLYNYLPLRLITDEVFSSTPCSCGGAA